MVVLRSRASKVENGTLILLHRAVDLIALQAYYISVSGAGKGVPSPRVYDVVKTFLMIMMGITSVDFRLLLFSRSFVDRK